MSFAKLIKQFKVSKCTPVAFRLHTQAQENLLGLARWAQFGPTLQSNHLCRAQKLAPRIAHTCAKLLPTLDKNLHINKGLPLHGPRRTYLDSCAPPTEVFWLNGKI